MNAEPKKSVLERLDEIEASLGELNASVGPILEWLRPLKWLGATFGFSLIVGAIGFYNQSLINDRRIDQAETAQIQIRQTLTAHESELRSVSIRLERMNTLLETQNTLLLEVRNDQRQSMHQRPSR